MNTTPGDANPIVQVLKQQVRDTRAAYYQGVEGVTYEDMAAAAARYLSWRNRAAAQISGLPVRTVTKAQIAHCLRSL